MELTPSGWFGGAVDANTGTVDFQYAEDREGIDS